MLFSNIFGLVLVSIMSLTVTDVHGRYLLYRPRPGVSGTVSHRKIVATWDEAKQRCEREGAILASPIDEGLLEYMKSSIGVNNHSTPYFIGMKAVGNPELIFVSVEGHLPDGAIDMIDELEPKVGDCLSMDRNNIKIVACKARLPYLCYIPNAKILETTEATTELTTQATTETTTEITTQATAEPTTEITTQATMEAITDITTQATAEPTTEITTQATTEATTEVTTQSTTNAGPVVVRGYKRFSTGSSYKLHLERKDWDDAEATCISEGADLVVINNEREANIVKRFAFSEMRSPWVIIGLRDFGEDGEWKSVHGEPIIELYNTWSPSRSKDRFCGSLKKTGKLDDQLCGAKYPFVCERKALL